MLELRTDRMLFTIPYDKHDKESIIELLKLHPEVHFVSFAGVDIAGNDTDERIPIKLFIGDIDKMLIHGVQTDGSSVNLPRIAELNNAKVDMIPDRDVNWYVDYNFSNIDVNTGLPVGTLRIPSILVHNDRKPVGARAILRDSLEKFKADIMEEMKRAPYVADYIGGLDSVDDIEEIVLTSATELEFWVRTPDDKADREELSTSQELKEQYWKRTYGPVRTALEKTIEILDCYGLDMEMGHKEVGGVKSKLTSSGHMDHIMEQLEIDWKFASPMQAADNEKLVKYIVRDVFNEFGLNTTFKAKPVEGVAGSGEHTHLGVCARLKSGEMINLFNTKDMTEDFMSPIGYGSLMGILKNYEAMNPFISSTTNSFKRLKPGYEAPICIVTSLGHDPKEPSRNRTILIGLVRDLANPMATRFELRSPNPKSNTYLVLATGYMAMLNGIKAALEGSKTPKDLEASISKKTGEKDFYLEEEREYRSEKNVFEDFTAEERSKLFGNPPRTVWENLRSFDMYPDKVAAVTDGIMDEQTLDSYRTYILNEWATEYHFRNIPNAMDDIKECVKAHGEDATDFDEASWDEINKLRFAIAKDSMNSKSLLTRAREALDRKDYDLASELQIEIQSKVEDLKKKYSDYKRNLFL
ncbi:MAG: glutamine synthetase [Firmicutes bacterium]|nr:glutamine synthetase [Bacillota bacterium]